MLAAVEVEVMLAGQFVHRVRRQWRLGRVFVDRLTFAIIAIHRRTGGKQHAFDPGLAHGFADVQRADEVALVRAHRIVHRGLHRSHGREVRHSAASSHRPGNQSRIGHVAYDQFDPGIVQRQIAVLAGGQVIENPHRMAPGKQGVSQV
ncbi:hypothetical protein D3C81_1752380 [compost metagenome]